MDVRDPCNQSLEPKYDGCETYILLPKKYAQNTRIFLSNETRFLSHKGFLKGYTDDTGEDLLGIPVQRFQLKGNAKEDGICAVTSDNISQKDLYLCEQLALQLNISLKSIQIKVTNNYKKDIAGSFNSERKCKGSKKNLTANIFERLERACFEIQQDLELNIGSSLVPRHWEIHHDLVLFPPHSFKDILMNFA